VDLCNSVAIFLSSRTFTSAEKIESVMFVSLTTMGSISSIDRAGKSTEERLGVWPEMFENNAEKNPPWVGNFAFLAVGGSGFSDPVV
jgi:hypothetical protein